MKKVSKLIAINFLSVLDPSRSVSQNFHPSNSKVAAEPD